MQVTEDPLAQSIKPYRWRFGLGALLGGLSLGSAIGLLATSAWLISTASTHPPILTLEVAVVSVRFFALARGLLRYTERLVSHDAVFRTLTRLRIFVYQKLEAAAPAALPLFRRGELLNRAVNDVETIQDLWLRVIIPWLSAAVSAAGGIGIVWWLLPRAGLLMLITSAVGLIAVPLISFFLSGSSASDSLEVESKISGDITSICDSLLESLAYGQEAEIRSDLRESHEALLANEAKTARGTGVGALLITALTGISILGGAVLALDAYRIGSLAGVNVAVIVLLPLAIFEGISLLPAGSANFGRIQTARRNIESISAFRVPTAATGTATVPVTEINVLTAREFSAGWSEARNTLKPVSFELSTGEILLIQGPSGIGKSTLAYAIAGFLPYRGSLAINGVDLSLVDRDDLSKHVLYGLQEAHLFATSIRENLKIGRKDATDDELLRVLDVVELGDYIRSLPNALGTHIGQFGYNFSGGERQRLTLARILLSKAPIVILDEPTEHLDEDQALRIEESLVQELHDRLLIVISHRTWSHADQRFTLAGE